MTFHSTRRIAAILASTALLWTGGWTGMPAPVLAASGPTASYAVPAHVAGQPAGRVDETPRMAILSAFAPELDLLRAACGIRAPSPSRGSSSPPGCWKAGPSCWRSAASAWSTPP